MTWVDGGRRSQASRPFGDEGPGLIALWVILVEAWLERRRQRLALMALSGHLLRDIGVSRAEALREARKPFWRP